MTKEEFLKQKQAITEEIFSSARKLEELQGEARLNWEEAADENEASYWNDMQYFLEDQASALDGIYSELTEDNDDTEYNEDDEFDTDWDEE